MTPSCIVRHCRGPDDRCSGHWEMIVEELGEPRQTLEEVHELLVGEHGFGRRVKPCGADQEPCGPEYFSDSCDPDSSCQSACGTSPYETMGT